MYPHEHKEFYLKMMIHSMIILFRKMMMKMIMTTLKEVIINLLVMVTIMVMVTVMVKEDMVIHQIQFTIKQT